MKNLTGILVTAAALVSIPAHAQWQPYMGITSNYFEGDGTGGDQIVLTLDSNFHQCGWNNAVNINSSVVGERAFKSYTAIVLTAWTTNKKVSVATSGCWGDRAKGVSMRLGN